MSTQESPTIEPTLSRDISPVRAGKSSAERPVRPPPLPDSTPDKASETAAAENGDAAEPPIAQTSSGSVADPAAPTGRRIESALQKTPPWAVSMLLHLVGLLLLAFWTLVTIEEKVPNVLIASTVEDARLEVQEFELVELEEVELENVSLDMKMPDPGQIALASIESVPVEADLNVASVADVTTREIGALFGDHGKGMSTIGEGMGAASFFGAQAQGSRFMFVVDNSNSMGGGRFETALGEMMKTVDGMSPYQYFYVVFFSDTAYPLFHPRPAKTMVRATDENKQRLRSWLKTVEMCLKTKGVEAMQTAFAMQPDVIYILGDGRFTDRAGAMLVAPHKRKVPIHTLGMEVDPIGKREFQAIARANQGTYRNVSANRYAKAMAAKNPIKKNRSHGYVWGTTLPDAITAPRRR